MRSKTLASWLALLGGPLGLHRFYLFGPADLRAWLHLPPTLLGLYGVSRMQGLGQDDRLAWLLVPVLGIAISHASAMAIYYGLMREDRWELHHGAGGGATGWGSVIAAVLALLVGATVLLGTIAFGFQKLFEAQLGP